MRAFQDLDERELLALAIANEEEDGRIYADFAEHLRDHYPDSAKLFDDMVAEEDQHYFRVPWLKIPKLVGRVLLQ